MALLEDRKMAAIVLLQAVVGVARTVRSLFGPTKLRKQVTDESDHTFFSADAYTVVSVLQSQNAGTFIFKQALEEQRKTFGTGTTTMVTLCGVLAETVLELHRQGFQTDIIQQALTRAETCCHETIKHMRLSISQVIPSFQDLTWTRQLTALRPLLSTNNMKATSLAMEVVSALHPTQFSNNSNFSLQDLVTTHIVLGGITSTESSKVYYGLLLPVAETSLHSTIRRRTIDGTIPINGGVVLLAGDLETTAFSKLVSTQIIFVYGEISFQAIDASNANPNAALCIPVSSYEGLCQLAKISGAAIVETWDEVLPEGIGHKKFLLKTLDVSGSKVQEDRSDKKFPMLYLQVLVPSIKYQPHVSVIIQGPTHSLALEIQTEMYKVVRRVYNVLRSGYVLPGNGTCWCACAAAITEKAKTRDIPDVEELNFTTTRLAHPFSQLGVILLENSGENRETDGQKSSFFLRLARVRSIEKHFARSIQDVGSRKFFATYFDYRNSAYSVFLSDQMVHFDEYKSIKSVVRASFRIEFSKLFKECQEAKIVTFPLVSDEMSLRDVAMASTGDSLKRGTGIHVSAVIPLDYSFMGLVSLSEMQRYDPVGGKKRSQQTAPKKRQSPVSLRVNNNKIFHLNDMNEALCAVFEYPAMLQWLDLSGNQLKTIHPQAFSAYPELLTLHLHGNLLSKYSDVDALAKWLPHLHSITLHGNPLQEKKHYRNYVIANFPALKQLDFSSVTIGDRKKAETWTRIYKNARHSTVS